MDLPDGRRRRDAASVEITGTLTAEASRRAPARHPRHRPLHPDRAAAGCSSTARWRLTPTTWPWHSSRRPSSESRSTLEAGDVLAVSAHPAGQPGPRLRRGVADARLRRADRQRHRAARRGRGRASAADVAVVVVGTTDEVESEGFDRSTLALPGRPGRAGPAGRGGQPAHDRRGQRRIASRAAVGRRRRGRAAGLVPRPGSRARACRRAARRRRAGRTAAHDLAGRDADCPVLSVTPADGVLRYDEGVFIGYRAWERTARGAALRLRARPRLHHLGVRATSPAMAGRCT